ncbi:MAG: polysaccharide pyruvyl transferase family protein [Clostridia bacterium]|nr:polysaccharide pyruvyl transferase family protein [Clostridia bacterium]
MKNKNKRALVLWYKYGNNLGDYYIYKTVAYYLSNWGFEIEDCEVGEPFNNIAKKSKNVDLVWFAGGGIIERYVPDIIVSFKKFHKRSRYVKYGVTGLSIGDFSYDYYKKSIQYWVKNSLFFFSRDDYTANKLNELSNCKIVSSNVDVVFATPYFHPIRERSNNRLGVNFRPLPYPDLTGELNLLEWKKEISLLGFNDIETIADQLQLIKCGHYYTLNKDYSPQKAVETISKIDLGIAMRYHVILIAALYNKVCLPICYCPKISRLSAQLGIEDLSLGINEYTLLPEILKKYIDNKDYYNDLLSKNVLKMKKMALTMFETIKTILEKSI